MDDHAVERGRWIAAAGPAKAHPPRRQTAEELRVMQEDTVSVLSAALDVFEDDLKDTTSRLAEFAERDAAIRTLIFEAIPSLKENACLWTTPDLVREVLATHRLNEGT